MLSHQRSVTLTEASITFKGHRHTEPGIGGKITDTGIVGKPARHQRLECGKTGKTGIAVKNSKTSITDIEAAIGY